MIANVPNAQRIGKTIPEVSPTATHTAAIMKKGVLSLLRILRYSDRIESRSSGTEIQL